MTPWALTLALFDLWRVPYSGRYARFVAHIEATRVTRGIPSLLG